MQRIDGDQSKFTMILCCVCVPVGISLSFRNTRLCNSFLSSNGASVVGDFLFISRLVFCIHVFVLGLFCGSDASPGISDKLGNICSLWVVLNEKQSKSDQNVSNFNCE